MSCNKFYYDHKIHFVPHCNPCVLYKNTSLPIFSLFVCLNWPISSIQCKRQLYCTRILSIRAYEQGLHVTTYALVMPLGPNDTELSSQLSKGMSNTLLNHLCTWLFRALPPYNWLQHCNCEETMIRWLEANTKTLPRNHISRWTAEERTVCIQLWPPVDSPWSHNGDESLN